MAEGGVDENYRKKGSARRSFLKRIGLGALAVVFSPSLIWGLETLAASEDHLAKMALLADIKRGEFTPDSIRTITSTPDLKNRIIDKTEDLKGVSSMKLYFDDGSKSFSVNKKADSSIFLPASTIKVLICYEAWKMGKKEGQDYLTPELSSQILEKSYTFMDLLMKLPLAQNRKPEQLEEIVRDLLTQAGIKPLNQPGNLPLKVSLDEMHGYLLKMQMPAVMKQAMLQNAGDHNKNYGVSTVILQNSHHKLPAYFKIGLIYDETVSPSQLVNSYYLQMGEKIKVLGYAKGTDLYEVHKQMLYTAAMTANYAVNSS